ncbi:hypothetical protein E2542_SST07399 [Spatholobus suberectus]|nr:hypothetical protein E2542_SST07399 [Spatholobus suberectus]
MEDHNLFFFIFLPLNCFIQIIIAHFTFEGSKAFPSNVSVFSLKCATSLTLWRHLTLKASSLLTCSGEFLGATGFLFTLNNRVHNKDKLDGDNGVGVGVGALQ